MGNKQTLQEHNINLSSILSTIGSLPIKSDVEEQASVGLYVWKKLTAEGGDFIDFAVSDNESKYPDGGTQDGYWYEKVVEGTDLSASGFSKISAGQFTITSSAQSFTLNHGLGETPKLIFIYVSASDVESGASLSSNSFWFMTGTTTNWGGLYKSGTGVSRCTATATVSSETSDSINITTAAKGYSGSTLTVYWKSGLTYNFIAMA